MRNFLTAVLVFGLTVPLMAKAADYTSYVFDVLPSGTPHTRVNVIAIAWDDGVTATMNCTGDVYHSLSITLFNGTSDPKLFAFKEFCAPSDRFDLSLVDLSLSQSFSMSQIDPVHAIEEKSGTFEHLALYTSGTCVFDWHNKANATKTTFTGTCQNLVVTYN